MKPFRTMATLFVAGLLVAASSGSGPPGAAQSDLATPATTDPSRATTEQLFDVTFPAGVVPEGEAFVEFFRVTFQPGASYAWPAGVGSAAVGVDLVVSGSYGVTFDGPVTVIRAGEDPAGATPNAVGASEEIVAGPGDVLRYDDLTSAATYRNAGPEPLVLLTANIVSTAPFTGTIPDPVGDIAYDLMAELPPDRWVPGANRLTLARHTLPPGASAAPSAELDPTLRFVESGTLSWEVVRPEEASPPAPLEIPAGRAVPYQPLRAGWTLVLGNGGEEPCAWLELTVS